jgi:hypothetical protein
VKPVTPRQVYAAIAGILDGPRLRQQAITRRFVERFRVLQSEPIQDQGWRAWIDRYSEVTQWDLDLIAANETGLYESLQGLYPDLRRDFALYMKQAYPAWLKNLEGDRPPLSIDIVPEFLVPILKTDKQALFIVIDCLRLDQWRALEPIISPLFDIETTHYFSILPTATPYSRNALFSGLFPGEIAARFPDWWGEREDETLNAHERELLEAQLAELKLKVPVRYEKVSTAAEGDDIERRLSRVIAPEGISAFVFNFVDLLTHGRSESAILFEVARDELALRELTYQWFRRSALFSVLQEAARRNVKVLVTSDHGSIHCRTPATVFAKRDATQNLRYKFGEDLRAENPEYALQFTNEDSLKLPRRGLGANSLAGDWRLVLRLSDEAARVLEPVSRLVPAWRRHAGGVHSAGVAADAAAVAVYARLLQFLRPHWWRLAGNVLCSIIAAALDGLSFTLLIPFLNKLDGKATAIPDIGFVSRLLNSLIGRFLDNRSNLDALGAVIIAIGVVIVVKNVFVWIAGQLGASLQEYVTRDLRDAVFRHMSRLPLGYFHRTKVGQIIAKIVSDTDQTKVLVTELVTRTIQNAAQIITYIVILLGMSVKLTLLSLVVAPLLTLALQPLLRRLRHGYRRSRSDYGEATSVLQEVVTGIRPGEVVRRRRVRRSPLRRREPPILGRHGQDQPCRRAVAAADRDHRDVDRDADPLDRRARGAERCRTHRRRGAHRLHDDGHAVVAAAQAAISDTNDRTAGVRRRRAALRGSRPAERVGE